jgi:hypothetical protein
MNLFITRLKALLDHLNGCSIDAPAWLGRNLPGWTWGVWWATLLGLIALFCGQSSKFIYIDF